MEGQHAMLQNADDVMVAMQPHFTPAAASMNSGATVDEANVGQLAEIDARLSRTIDLPAPRSPAAVPKLPLRQRLRRPLMILFPVILAAVGTAYYLAEAPYVVDRRCLRSRGEGIDQRPGCRSGGGNRRQGQSAGQAGPVPVPDRSGAVPDCRRSGRGAARHRASADRRAQGHLAPATGRAAIGERYRRLTISLSMREGRRWSLTVGRRARSMTKADTDLKVARQHVASIEHQIANTVAALNGDPNIEIDRHPTVRAAKAQLDRARLNLSYATVTAPDDGIVTRVDDLQVGDFVNPGAAVFSLMSSRRIWIEANFRETGLTHMRPGQEATIDVDAYPDRTFKAHVVSMSPGTGSDFAVLPPENATGNWVKVVQRLPVRLEFDEDRSEPAAVLGHQCHRAGRHRLSSHLAPSAAARARDGGGQVSAALASSTAADGHRAIIVAALMATYMQAVNISLPNAALLLYPGHAVDGRRRGRLDIYRHISRRASSPCRWRAGLRVATAERSVYQLSIAVFALGLVLATRATTPMQFIAARIVQGAASGPLAPLSMAILLDIAAAGAARPHQSGRGRHACCSASLSGPSIGGWLSEYHGWHVDVLSQPAEWRASSSWRWRSRFRGQAGRAEASVRLLRPDDVLARHGRVADGARPRRAHGVVRLGRDLGGGDCLGAGFLPLLSCTF